jgi:hypothetical protein
MELEMNKKRGGKREPISTLSNPEKGKEGGYGECPCQCQQMNEI